MSKEDPERTAYFPDWGGGGRWHSKQYDLISLFDTIQISLTNSMELNTNREATR
jgi:hypothetical protein